MTTGSKTLSCALLLTLGGLLTGCSGSSDPSMVSYGDITGNLTPELRGTADRPIDIDRKHAVNHNQNLRMANDDLRRWWYYDSPSMLTPYPTVRTSGMPR